MREAIIEMFNQYGSLKLEIIGEYQDVSGIHSRNLNKELFFDIETAEKIALITENRGIQLSVFSGDHSKMFVVHHATSSSAAVCKLVELKFKEEINARDEIERLSRKKLPLV